MIYLLYGLEEYLINKEITKILDSHKLDKINISKYDLEVNNIEEVIKDASMMSLFSEEKGIIVTNSYLFTGKGSTIEHNIEMLERYINDINTTTIMIFTVIYDKLDERKKIVKLLKEKAKVIMFNKEQNITNIVKDMFNGYEISSSDLNYFINRVGNNLDLISNEVNKLLIYKIDNKVITKEDITSLVSQNIDADIFKLIEELVNKNKDNALRIYAELVKINEEPIKIIVMLANQFRLMYQSKELSLKGYSEGDIASMLSVHPYRVKLAKDKARNYSTDTLVSYLNDLADLDYNIKLGNIDKNLGLELFIINI